MPALRRVSDVPIKRDSGETAARVVSILDRIRERMLADGTLTATEDVNAP